MFLFVFIEFTDHFEHDTESEDVSHQQMFYVYAKDKKGANLCKKGAKLDIGLFYECSNVALIV